MSDMGTKKASELWGYTQPTIRKWCAEGKSRVLRKISRDQRGIFPLMQNARSRERLVKTKKNNATFIIWERKE